MRLIDADILLERLNASLESLYLDYRMVNGAIETAAVQAQIKLLESLIEAFKKAAHQD